MKQRLEIDVHCVARHCLTEDRQAVARSSVEPVFSRRNNLRRVAISNESIVTPIYGTTDKARFRLMDSLNALDRMVQRSR